MYETPFVHQYACTRTYRTGAFPSCKYFGVCWPKYLQEGPFPVEE